MTIEIPRDQWGRPLIIPEGGGTPVGYTRASTLAKALDDLNNLMMWKQRKTAQGLLVRPDLLTRLAGVLANGNPDEDWPTKRALNDICDEATEAAGASSGASAGTGFHALTEALDRGLEIPYVPEADKPRLTAYAEAHDGYVALDIETFVVNDALRTAGTFDRLWLCPDGRVRVGDLKTGKSEADYPLATAMQLAIYAGGMRYDPETGERTPLHDDLDPSTGLLTHLPATGGCTIYPLDLERGRRAAELACEIHHEVRRWKPADLILEAVGL
jgi:hypothetical protein